jgi:hypothetical protein
MIPGDEYRKVDESVRCSVFGGSMFGGSMRFVPGNHAGKCVEPRGGGHGKLNGRNWLGADLVGADLVIK